MFLCGKLNLIRSMMLLMKFRIKKKFGETKV